MYVNPASVNLQFQNSANLTNKNGLINCITFFQEILSGEPGIIALDKKLEKTKNKLFKTIILTISVPSVYSDVTLTSSVRIIFGLSFRFPKLLM